MTNKEQQKIASCLSSLDALFTAQADKIEQLKLHKKSLMQGLFPKIQEQKMSKLSQEYKQWIVELKGKIRSAQAKAAISVNTELIQLYWELGKMSAAQENTWGSKLIARVSKDLQAEFPDLKGLTRSNLFYCKQFYSFYNDND